MAWETDWPFTVNSFNPRKREKNTPVTFDFSNMAAKLAPAGLWHLKVSF